MPTKDEVVVALKGIVDPHTGVDVYSMGLVTDLKVDKGKVSLTFTPTSPFCPMGVQLAVSVKRAVMCVEGVKSAEIDVQGHMQSAEINDMLKKLK
jgi:metal-sulfur cluster biosynthetic enzyme